MKKLVTLALLALVFALAACGDDSAPAATAPAAAETAVAPADTTDDTPAEPEGPPVRDLGGLEITIATWWADEATDTVDPQTALERMRWDDRADLEALHNFRIRTVNMGGWTETRDMMPFEIAAGNRDIQIWVMEPTWFSTMHGQNLLAPIALDNFHPDINWNQSVMDFTMRGGLPHAFAMGTEFAGGVYFNMRLFEEAGFPPDYPFQLQAEGRWNWETFTEVARALSRDLDNDGINDTWAMSSFNQDFLDRALASNGAAFVSIDPTTGEFINTTNTPQFLETINWVVQLREEMLAMHEDDIGAEWNFFIDAFNSGLSAMRSAGHYVASGEILPNLADPWGFVSFPAGPSGGDHYSWVTSNFNAIPQFYTEEEIDDFMFAIYLWNRPLPGADDDDWMFGEYARHADPRSVDETMVNFTRNPYLQVMPAHQMIPGGIDVGPNWAWRIWADNDAATIVEEAMQVLDERLNQVNTQLGS
ncbi:MAG: extracellular solute-binding protein [Firmicutes bacterium]|nr:extracellular solute-binding protein [Bacillota bacterium]